NGDGDFTIADMVIVQKHIMGKKTAVLSDWKCADLYEDGKIDVYDFIVMRENFVKNMK
ncbi:MAG: dockerin type I repeat-containing protein, partial [Ruminococcus sp.]|nr:dockerin type I repeat-containing protein [Ruminococcus sp.]